MKRITVDFYQFNHAVRTPLTGILGLAGLLKQEKLTPQQSCRIRGILQAGREMLQFIEKLEAKKSTSLAIRRANKSGRAKTVNSKVILLVEDHPIIQQVHAAMLNNLGFSVDVVASGKEALKKFSQKYAAVLLDIGLPDQSGVVVAKAIRKQERGFGQQLIPIIAVTAQADNELRENCLQAGINECLAKPVTQDQLGKIINHWLKATAKPCKAKEEL